MKHPICVVIPCRPGSNARVTLKSLAAQSSVDLFDVHIVQDDEQRGQAWALNQGLAWVRQQHYEFVLFSDDDILWRHNAVEVLYAALKGSPESSYAYGTYELVNGHHVFAQCSQWFDPALLRRVNYISTMSMVRVKDTVDFDETLVRLIDWDYWLTLLDAGAVGVHCGEVIFSTMVRQGITESDKANNRIRKEAVAMKHGLPLEAVL